MNKFTIEITKDGFTETLLFKGKTYVKRYAKTKCGYDGLDLAWDEEDDLFELIDVLEERDPLYIMDALEEEEES